MKTTGIKTVFLCGALSFGAAAPALAQGGVIETVTVTAQRKAERLVDVPISVNVISGEALKDINLVNMQELAFIAPSVTYNTNFGGGLQLRGIGTQAVNMSIEQSVSVVIDDVVKGLPEVQFAGPSYQALTDVDRIEILNGPQGTLFGKNSSAGVIQVITKRPDITAFAADGSIAYGTDNEVKASGNVNLPVNDTMAVRLSAYNNSRDGFVRNVFTGQDVSGYHNYGFRLKHLWQPNDRLETYLIASLVETSDTGNGIWTLRSCGSGSGTFSACNIVRPLGVTPGPENLSGAWNARLGARSEGKEISARVSYDLGFGMLKSITAYQTVDIDEFLDVDSSPRPILANLHQVIEERGFSQEVRLEGKAYDMIDYTAGFYYSNTRVRYESLQGGTFNILPDNSPFTLTNGTAGTVPCCLGIITTSTDSWSFFGQASVRVLEDFVLTGGMRYTSDENDLNYLAADMANVCQFAFGTGAPCKPATLGSQMNGSISADNLSGKITVQYFINPDVNVYGTYATGYKGPSVSYARNLPLIGVEPETAVAYEAGVKGTVLDGRLFLAAAYFNTKYTNFQGQAFYTDPISGARAQVTTNAGGLRTSGFEFQASARPTDELSLSFAITYASTEFISFFIPCNDRYTNPSTPPGQCIFVNPQVPGLLQYNAAGFPVAYAPEVRISLGASYTRPISENELIRATMNYRWQDEYYTIAADPNSIVPSYGLLGATIGIGAQDESWMFSFFVRNLLDEYFVTGIFPTALDAGTAGSTPLSTRGYSNTPSVESSRTIGVKLEVKMD